MNNINLFSTLFKHLFYLFNKITNIKASKLLNMIDSTLIPEKDSNFINNKDWSSGRVTTRGLKQDKTHICGSKGFFMINREGKIYHLERLNINYSDQNYLKNPYFLLNKLKGIVLADRGFSNKAVRERLEHNKTDIFNYDKPVCRLISPYRVNQLKKLTTKERKIYRKRWKIETMFQILKDSHSNIKLNLKGKYTSKLKEAKLFACAINYNLSM